MCVCSFLPSGLLHTLAINNMVGGGEKEKSWEKAEENEPFPVNVWLNAVAAEGERGQGDNVPLVT